MLITTILQSDARVGESALPGAFRSDLRTSTVRNERDVGGDCKHIFHGQPVQRPRGRGTQAMSTAWKPIQCEQSMEDG